MLSVKPGVVLEDIDSNLVQAMLVVDACYGDHGLACVITSGREGQHKDGSKHYLGKALDFRTRHVPAHELQALVDDIRIMLGADYDTILESTHLHIEYDPKDASETRGMV
jgi:hypothetical protein